MLSFIFLSRIKNSFLNLNIRLYNSLFYYLNLFFCYSIDYCLCYVLFFSLSNIFKSCLKLYFGNSLGWWFNYYLAWINDFFLKNRNILCFCSILYFSLNRREIYFLIYSFSSLKNWKIFFNNIFEFETWFWLICYSLNLWDIFPIYHILISALVVCTICFWFKCYSSLSTSFISWTLVIFCIIFSVLGTTYIWCW